MAVLVIEPASAGTAIIDAACRLGKQPIVLTGRHGEQEARNAARRCGAGIVEVDTNDSGALVEVCTEIAGTQAVDAVVPGMEYYVAPAAEVAEAVGLPGITVEVATRMRDKYRMRRCLERAGVATPRFARLAGGEADIEAAARHTGLPAVLKPVDGCGSLGVRRVDSVADLRAAMHERSTNEIADMGRRVGKGWMLESYLEGPEYSLEGVVTPDGPRILSITRKVTGAEPYFVEMGHVVGEIPTAEFRESVSAYGCRAISALGLSLGVFHAELRYTAAGPVLIEAAARLGGDGIPHLIELAFGASLAELMVRSHCGDPLVDVQAHPMPRRLAAVRFFTRNDVSPRVGGPELETLRRSPGIHEVRVDAGQSGVAGPVVDFRGRIAHVVCTGASADVLDARLAHASAVLSGGLGVVAGEYERKCV